MPAFPIDLLNASKEKKKQYFKDYIVHHKNLDVAIDETMKNYSCMRSVRGRKQELVNGVKQQIIETVGIDSNQTTDCIPIVEVEAIAPVEGSFGFPNLWKRALAVMSEPLMDYKMGRANIEGCDNKGNRIIKYEPKQADFEEILINTLKHRHVKAMIINEAHHMLMVSTAKKQTGQLTF